MSRPKILYADNNEKHLQSFGDVLSSAGYEVVRTSSMARVPELIREDIFDLAVLDLHWNNDSSDDDLSGFDLSRVVSRFTSCIFLTASLKARDAAKALRDQRRGGAAAVDFVIKDEGAEALLEAVQAAIVPRIFLVHGHDNEAALLVERFLLKTDTQPILLRDLPGAGKAIIEKLERYANVVFAIVLLTPDDLGRRKSDPPSSRPRARQNVVFELGYFIGRLGRSRVAVLHKAGDDLELPSDYIGVQYIPMDSGKGWQLELAEEIRHAGIEIAL